jgi:hypothetical protein
MEAFAIAYQEEVSSARSDEWTSSGRPWERIVPTGAGIIIGSYKKRVMTVDVVELARQIVASEFKRLASAWREQRNPISSADDEIFAESQPYQEIIGLGWEVVPFLLQELRKDEPEPWFWALAAITRLNPVPVESRGNLRESAAAWIRWGFRNFQIFE